MVDQKFICPFCGFESSGAGICPNCDENLEKVCHCGSGKFSSQCCREENSSAEEKKAEELIKAEVSGEALSEIAEEDKKKLEEEAELENVEEEDAED